MAQPVRLAGVTAALELSSHELISLVGGGGKSTLLFALGGSLRGEVILTTTTRMGEKQTNSMTPLMAPSDEALTTAVHRRGRILVWDHLEAGSANQPGKAVGVSPDTADRWFDLADHVVVEADGSRQMPFKAPAPHEPQLPGRSTVVVAVIGADAIGRCIGDQCFRPMRVAAIAGCGPYDRLTPERAARVLADDRGSRKGVPASARFVVAITKVDQTNQLLVDETADALGAHGVRVITVATEH